MAQMAQTRHPEVAGWPPSRRRCPPSVTISAMAPDPGTPTTPLARALRAEATMIRVRWAGVVFATLQVATYYLPYPPGVLPVAIGIVALLAAGNAGVWLAYRRVTTY